ncbi:hypothetical protein KSS87_000554 [Heliosperma pusillum]|nr:hypothetical protein KSS87_000554 [Heliosperma pusillum]
MGDLSHLPDVGPGYVFQPEKQLLIQYYLKKKIRGEKLPPNPKIIETEVYKEPPWELLKSTQTARGVQGQANDVEAYFFTKVTRVTKGGSKISRTVKDHGTWEVKGLSSIKDVEHFDRYFKISRYFKFTPDPGQGAGELEWQMHEYISPENKDKDMVLCHIVAKNSKNIRTPLHTGDLRHLIDTEIIGPGYVFQPEKQLLIEFYLKKKNRGEQLPLYPKIIEAEAKDDVEAYFYTKLTKTSKLGSRIIRTIKKFGKWKEQQRKIVEDDDDRVVGNYRYFKFMPDQEIGNDEFEWQMHEYSSLESNDKDMVLCHIVAKDSKNIKTGTKKPYKRMLVEDDGQQLSGFRGRPSTQQVNTDAASAREEGNECLKSMNFTKAIECYSKSIDLSPNTATFSNRAIAYIKVNKYQEAENDLNESLKLDASNWKAYCCRAVVRKVVGNLKGALEDVEFGLKFDPENEVLMNLRAHIHACQSLASAFTERLYIVLLLLNYAAYVKEGDKCIKSKNFTKAIEWYSKSIDLSPNPATISNRALAYYAVENYQEAENDCTASLQLDANYLKAYWCRALARRNVGNLKEALDDVELGLMLEPKNGEVKKLQTELKSPASAGSESDTKMLNVAQIMDVKVEGVRFRPTKPQLIGYFLATRLKGEPLPPFYPQLIDYDVYTDHPYNILYSTKELRRVNDVDEGFFFSRLNKNGKRIIRSIKGHGKWWEKSATHKVYDGNLLIGIEKYFKFKPVAGASHGNEDEWKMHEYYLNGNNGDDDDDERCTEMVLCHITKKADSDDDERCSGVKRSRTTDVVMPLDNEGSTSKQGRIEYDQPAGCSSGIINPIQDHVTQVVPQGYDNSALKAVSKDPLTEDIEALMLASDNRDNEDNMTDNNYYNQQLLEEAEKRPFLQNGALEGDDQFDIDEFTEGLILPNGAQENTSNNLESVWTDFDFNNTNEFNELMNVYLDISSLPPLPAF